VISRLVASLSFSMQLLPLALFGSLVLCLLSAQSERIQWWRYGALSSQGEGAKVPLQSWKSSTRRRLASLGLDMFAADTPCLSHPCSSLALEGTDDYT
jgi:hypothetical protein